MAGAPQIAALALGGLILYEFSRRQTASDLTKSSVQQNSSTTTRQRNLAEMDHPANHQIWVDTPVNTVLENGPTGQTLSQVYRQQRAQYVKEASASPGVNLVAHTVA